MTELIQEQFANIPAPFRDVVVHQLSPEELEEFLYGDPSPGLVQKVDTLMRQAAANYRNILLPWPINPNLPCLLSPIMTQLLGQELPLVGNQAVYTYALLQRWWESYVQNAGLLQQDGIILPDELMHNIFGPNPPATLLELNNTLRNHLDCQTVIPMTPEILIYLSELGPV